MFISFTETNTRLLRKAKQRNSEEDRGNHE
jgi:hypothetical protein